MFETAELTRAGHRRGHLPETADQCVPPESTGLEPQLSREFIREVGGPPSIFLDSKLECDVQLTNDAVVQSRGKGDEERIRIQMMQS
jgi:hypothetical protein